MFNPFPHLLYLGPFFVPTLLRLAASLTLVYMTARLMRERSRLRATALPVVGKAPAWLAWILGIVLLFVAFLLFVGLGTQWAAIVAMLIALKQLLLPKRWDSIRILSRDASALLFVLALALLFTGAGAFGFDLPL